jgi:two-component system, LuxR family, response regulator FixJ
MPEATVYIVDDDEAVRAGLGALLAARGFDVRPFGSAEAFLSAAPTGANACLLLDVRMPGMSGLELQRELKGRGIALPIIMITGHGDVPMAVAALKGGAVDFLEKPFDADVLLAAIDEAFRRVSTPAGRLPAGEVLAQSAAQLTPREREVMDLVVAGLANKAIATRLRIALRTVEIHRSRVMEKMGARHLSELVRMAIRLEEGA